MIGLYNIFAKLICITCSRFKNKTIEPWVLLMKPGRQKRFRMLKALFEVRLHFEGD